MSTSLGPGTPLHPAQTDPASLHHTHVSAGEVGWGVTGLRHAKSIDRFDELTRFEGRFRSHGATF
jgi:hypothetical protein